MKSNLAVISNVRMKAMLVLTIGDVKSLLGMANEKSARKNLRRALSSLQNVMPVYEHFNLKPRIEKKMPNPQKTRYLWHG